MNKANLVKPDKTALIVIDKQVAYFDPKYVGLRGYGLPRNSSKVLKNIDNFILNARQAKVPIIWTKMIEDSELSPENIAIKMRHDQYTTISKPNHVSFNIYGAVKPLDSEKVIIKDHYDAFSVLELATHLSSLSIENVILIGGYGSRCILSTAVGANNNNLNVVIPKGLIINQKTTVKEIKPTLNIIDAILGYVMTPEEILAYWQ